MARQLPIDGARLLADREAVRMSREALARKAFEEGLAGFSISSLRRAERGWASAPILNSIALALGFKPERYQESVGGIAFGCTFDLNGEWRSYYVEDDIAPAPYVATERLYLKHTISSIDGVFEPLRSEHPGGYRGAESYILEGVVRGGVALGRYSVGGRSDSVGTGAFQVSVLRDGEWAEGFCTYIDLENRVCASPIIWVSRKSRDFRVMQTRALEILRRKATLGRFPAR